MSYKNLSNLALAGLIAASTSACSTEKTKAKPEIKVVSEAKAPEAKAEEAKPVAYSDVHDCAGLNTCKGLGGCRVTQEKLDQMAAARGITKEEAGEPHACAGLNACKGLGGCHVTQEKFDAMKAKLAKEKPAAEEKPAPETNVDKK